MLFQRALLVVGFAWLAAGFALELLGHLHPVTSPSFPVAWAGAILVATLSAFWFLTTIDDLDISFQAYNAWHSVQALGIMWFAMNAKWRAGRIRGPKQSRFCKDGAFGFTYLWAVVFSVGIGALVILFSNFDVANLPRSPFYLSLIHI